MKLPKPSAWHRVFHPLCGADPLTLARLAARAGPLSAEGGARLGVALFCALSRLPFTLAEQAARAMLPSRPAPAPVFIVGHPRSGTTHLHNLLAAAGAFAIVPPVLAGMPWETRGLAQVMRPFIEPYLPETRIIDRVRVTPDSPTEDEVALANLCDLSYFHAIYFPRRFRTDYARGMLFEGASNREIARRMRRLRAWVGALSARGGGRPLLLKNPAYTADLRRLWEIWPEARVVHIHRDPHELFASTRRMLRTATAELGLQRADPEEIDAAVLEVYPEMMRRLAADAEQAPLGRFAQVAYEALDADPLGEVGRLWRALGLPEEARALSGVERYLAALGRYQKSPHALTPEERAQVTARWSDVHAEAARAGLAAA